MTGRLRDAFRRWFSRDGHVSSSVFVTVELLSVMRPRRLSKRVILKASLWTVILIMFAFIICYTILLAYVDRRVWLSNRSAFHTKGKKLQTRPSEGQKTHLEGRNPETKAIVNRKDLNRKIMWNPEKFYDIFAPTVKCHNNSLFTIIITSSANHFEQRVHIRKTWCNPHASGNSLYVWQCVFLVGLTLNADTDEAVEQEAEQHHDILLGTYIDSYRNLTRKVMHGVNWSTGQCSTPFTVKTDDDCFVNTKLLYNFLVKYNTQTSELYVGKINRVLNKRMVIRNEANRWYVSKTEYSKDYYPPYASGTGYVMSRDVVRMIADECKYIWPIPNEDAYVGIVIDSLGIKPTASERFTVFSIGLRVCNFLYVFIVHSVDPQRHSVLHKYMMDAHKQCSDKDIITWA
ncbi:beta-1,3-galactosyltransferase 5-like [Gigantopelta aegis]|uniref:beta-1,3-galactosyltransferase 5-like n=1 Tax=Gigantopelta aegis TaxID=1735272 RepID=UPI001B889CE7|nr:beta-1,3-galactosyltransferase 5-like [Gigantopelta aegis]